MVNKSLALVNQKLAYARATKTLLDTLSLPANASQRLQQQALLDAGAFHLMCAYRHYLRELGENYALPRVTHIDSEEALRKAFVAQGKSPAELQELQQLCDRGDTWLSRLKTAYRDCWQLADNPPAASASDGKIQILDLDAPEVSGGPVNRTKLAEWYGALTELIDRQRETSAEY